MPQERSSHSILYAMAAATIVVSVAVCVMIAVPTTLWLVVAYGLLLAVVGLVMAFIVRLIDTDH